MAGIRAELVFEGTDGCPVAALSSSVDTPVDDITWTAPTGGTVTEQVTVAGNNGEIPETRDSDGTGCAAVRSDGSPAFEEVFDYGSSQVYEFERGAGEPCICEYIERKAGPVQSVQAVDGNLHVTVHVAETDAMRDLVGDLKQEFGGVRIEYLVRSRTDSEEGELVPVDLDRLTDRQREVLERAHELGYFEYPRRANASEVADSLDIGPSTFIEHLNTAQTKLLGDLLGGQ